LESPAHESKNLKNCAADLDKQSIYIYIYVYVYVYVYACARLIVRIPDCFVLHPGENIASKNKLASADPLSDKRFGRVYLIHWRANSVCTGLIFWTSALGGPHSRHRSERCVNNGGQVANTKKIT
jgi:hypothetical protein